MNHEQIQSGFSRQQLEMELQRVERSRNRSGKLRNTILWMMIVAVALVSVSTIWFPIFWIENEPGQLLMTMRTQAVEPDDTIVCDPDEWPMLYQVVSVTDNEIGVISLDDRFEGKVQRISQAAVAGKVIVKLWPLPLEIYQ